MIRVKEAIVVEGKYDKIKLSSLVEGVIIETKGFGIFQDREKLAYLRALAKKRGLIVLTDSDGAGFVLRNYLKGALPKDRVKQAYIPDVAGKERRKRRPGKEGKLGVEGMRPEVLLEALRRAGLAGKVRLLAHDNSPETRTFLREGLLDFIIDQNLTYQSRKALSLLFDAVVEHRTPERDCFYPESPILTAENC